MIKPSPQVYMFLLMARLLVVVFQGYVHPDEFFQGPEIAAQDVLGVEGYTSWEFADRPPCRSIVPVWLTSGFAFFGLRLCQIGAEWINTLFHGRLLDVETFLVSTRVLYVMPKLIMVAFSFLLDGTALALCKRFHINPGPVLTTLGTSWVMLVFHTHTFSNTTEAVLLAALVGLVLLPMRPSAMQGLLIGVVGALGIFTRFTFAFYAAPLGAVHLHALFTANRSAWTSAARDAGRAQLVRSGSAVSEGVGRVVTGFAGAAAAMVAVDSVYFETLTAESWADPSTWRGSWTVTAWNSLAYNMDADNLARHGTHPRYLHATVNMTLLFGPLYAIALWRGWCFVRGARSTDKTRGMEAKRAGAQWVRAALGLGGSVVCGVGMLSLAPHQEARFLVPVLLPLCVLCGDALFGRHASPHAQRAWLAFNLALLLFFGGVHQGGVVGGIAHVQDHHVRAVERECRGEGAMTWAACVTHFAAAHEGHTDVVFAHTYMPPRHLFAVPAALANTVRIHDTLGLADGDVEALLRAQRAEAARASFKGDVYHHHQFFLSPASVPLPAAMRESQEGARVTEKRIRVHVSTENWPGGWADAALRVVHMHTAISFAED